MFPRIPRALAFLFAIVVSFALPAMAQEITPAERLNLRAEIRSYLLENPEVLMEAIAVLEERERSAQGAADQSLALANIDALHNDGFSYEGGNPEGDVVLVEFMDYRCPYCRQAFVDVEQLIEQDGNIRIILKELPILGEQSVLASRFAIATQIIAGDDAYKAVHDALMSINSDISVATLTRLANGLEIDSDEIIAFMDDDEVTDRIDATRQLAQAMNITGTPTLIFDDQILRGYVPLAQMQQIANSLRE